MLHRVQQPSFIPHVDWALLPIPPIHRRGTIVSVNTCAPEAWCAIFKCVHGFADFRAAIWRQGLFVGLFLQGLKQLFMFVGLLKYGFVWVTHFSFTFSLFSHGRVQSVHNAPRQTHVNLVCVHEPFIGVSSPKFSNLTTLPYAHKASAYTQGNHQSANPS